ncbi:PAS domain-containing protein [Flavobacterium sp. UBA6031]|uniref:PAS domain-containing protein n=1 Tax=Flavobacterium sp. UBA6031 TaxID=1946551 RepID=UPI0039C86F7C
MKNCFLSTLKRICNLSAEQINLIFNHLTVDNTFVDKNNTIRFFSNPIHSILPRTPAIIGRKFQFLHLHESVHVIKEMWIHLKMA